MYSTPIALLGVPLEILEVLEMYNMKHAIAQFEPAKGLSGS